MKLLLSVSLGKAQSKVTAKNLTMFERKELEVTETVLKELFTNHLYSTNWWQGGKCLNKNFLEMSGIIIDIDHGKTIEEAEELFKDYNYIIHTSTSHKIDNPKKGGECDRFRVILPFDPSEYKKINTMELAQATYEYILAVHPFIDPACTDPARKYYPFLNKDVPSLFKLQIHETGKYYSIDLQEVDKVKAQMVAEAPILSADSSKTFFRLADEVMLVDRVTKKQIKDTKGKTVCFCNFCDDINSETASAFLEDHRVTGRKMMVCSHCNKTYWLHIDDFRPGLFFIEDQLTRIYDVDGVVSVGRVTSDWLLGVPKAEVTDLRIRLANRAFSSQNFRVERKIDGYGSKSGWILNWPETIPAGSDISPLTVTYTPCPVNVQDNAYIERWLKEVFGIYYEFILDWLALYSYLNYKTLPVLIFTGARAAGKTTFAEFVAQIYPMLFQKWNGDTDQFTEHFEKRLLYIEEKPAERKVQYDMFKELTGSQYHIVNNKYGRRYQVKNSINIIMATNEDNPMYLVAKERSKSEALNQFFMYKFPPPPARINTKIGIELQARVGHFVRTVLRERYEQWAASGAERLNRYMLPTPITQLLIEQFDNSKTQADLDAEDAYQVCLNGRTMMDSRNNVMEVVGPFHEVGNLELRKIRKALNMPASITEKLLKQKMQGMGFLSNSITKTGKWVVIPPADDL